MEHGCICLPCIVTSRALKVPVGFVLHFIRVQLFLRGLAQVHRAIMEVSSRTLQPFMPLRNGPEFNAPQFEGKQPSRMLHALLLSELASKREECFRQGFPRGSRNHGNEAHGWHNRQGKN